MTRIEDIRTCQHLGYSQSKSNPSKPYCFKNLNTEEIKALLADSLFTILLYLSPEESFHPPIAMDTLTPLFFIPATLS